jgi:hypothetical protein
MRAARRRALRGAINEAQRVLIEDGSLPRLVIKWLRRGAAMANSPKEAEDYRQRRARKRTASRRPTFLGARAGSQIAEPRRPLDRLYL